MHTKTTSLTRLTSLCLAAAVAGCASEVVPATYHAPSNPADVHIYEKAPKKYESLGEISIPVVGKWDAQGDANNGFDRLRQQAAARGANGILLDPDEVHADYDVVAGDRGTFYHVPMRDTPTRTAVAEAIYVLEK